MFGGGERDYDDPSWNGYGGATFGADIATYGGEHGYGWVLYGPDDGNPFTTWHSLEVDGLGKYGCMDSISTDGRGPSTNR